MPEAEQELTAGYHTEYSGMKFALFFMAEYIKMIAVSVIAATLFFGGYLGPFVDLFPFLGPLYLLIKVLILLFGMIWVRATLPRLRYDQLIQAFGWKLLLPLSLVNVFVVAVGIVLEQVWLIPVLSLVVLFGSLAWVGLQLFGSRASQEGTIRFWARLAFGVVSQRRTRLDHELSCHSGKLVFHSLL